MVRLAIVGMACRFPDAADPAQLWENVLAGRRAFRPVPNERLNAADYFDADPAAPDRHYATHAAVLEGWSFDRARHRVAANVFRATDIAHWLALDTAAAALEDAGFPAGEGLDRARTGVVIGNTLTGDMTRATGMRLRWPYVRRTLTGALRRKGWDTEEIGAFLDEYEDDYKAPFPEITEDSLAGGLANTIAGRICNHFDFGGGGFTVDGACSSALLAVTQAGEALAAGRIDAAVVGGVDLSIDPFELIGFAKTKALSTSGMRVYDERSNGFWPGEGCGAVVLLRADDAVARGLRGYATIAGWGISSDGRGGITRPDRGGHLRAIERAYRMAGFGVESVDYLEGHGTGTAVGDRTELEAFDTALTARPADRPPVALGTIKGNIGHTKAAAGIAALIKAALAVQHGVIPPVTGNERPHPMLAGTKDRLYLPDSARPWPEGGPRRAGVSALGFGGINTHVVLTSRQPPRPLTKTLHTRLTHSAQDAELLVLSAATPARLQSRLREIAALAAKCSFAELGDLAAELIRTDADLPARAAVVTDQRRAEERLLDLAEALAAGERRRVDPERGQFLCAQPEPEPRIGYLFPGQGAPGRGDGGATARRFGAVAQLYRQVGAREGGPATEDAQPRIVTASLAGLRLLAAAEVTAVGCVGHSLGELTALHWAGVFGEADLVRTAEFRGRAMRSGSATQTGTMAALRADADRVAALIGDGPAVIAGYNGPDNTVIAGPVSAVEAVLARARAAGLRAQVLTVSHAFHSPLVAPAARTFRDYLEQLTIGQVERPGMVSTVTAGPLEPGTEVPELLERQVRAPVRFADALSQLAEKCDLLIEVGPGPTLLAPAAEICPGVPVVAMETDGGSVAGVLRALGACYALGAHPDLRALDAERFHRPFALDKRFVFLESPCEHAPDDSQVRRTRPRKSAAPAVESAAVSGSAFDTLRELLAGRAELALDDITPQLRPMDDLHLSSITITQLVADAVQRLGGSVPEPTTNVATATIAELAAAIEAAAVAGADAPGRDELPGVAPWVRPFRVDLVRRPLPPLRPGAPGHWKVFAPKDDRLAAAVRRRLDAQPLGSGVLLRAGTDPESIDRMLAAAQAALTEQVPFVVVDDDEHGAAAFAKSLHLEAPSIRTTVVHTAPDAPPTDTARLICADIAATETFREVGYDAWGARAEPVLRELTLECGELPLGPDDVLAVTGGARGITVECALALARATGCGLAVLARSDPDAPEVAANMARLRESGVTARYFVADVTDPERVAAAVAAVRAELGEITGILHGAARNAPAAIGSLTAAEIQHTLAPKVDGLHHLLAAVDRDALRVVVGFGSIIGRAGLRGEAHYALANDWLRAAIDRLDREMPWCRCLTIEWSVWAGTGMGERLGVLDSLMREGIEPLSTDAGIEVMLDLLRAAHGPTGVVVLGRTMSLPTIRFEDAELPLLRFLERPRLHFPGIELVADADISTGTDPYLAEHRLAGDALFPAVMGMEAMAQAATALLGPHEGIDLHEVEFLRPIVVPAEGVTIRVAALRSGDAVRVVIRCGGTGFQLDHFRGVCRPADAKAPTVEATAEPPSLGMPIDSDFYDRIMFHGPIFRAVHDYRHVAARACVARIGVGARRWFSPMVPNGLVLDDPAARDAFMHAIQVCVPDATLLPSKIAVVRGFSHRAREVTLRAVERGQEGAVYTYDLTALDPDGAPVAVWEGLELTAVAPLSPRAWTPELLGPYLQREFDALLPEPVRVAVIRDRADDHRAASARALTAALGRTVPIHYRPDGQPEIPGEHASFSHDAGLTIAVVGTRRVGCDIETVEQRASAEWNTLLGKSGVALAEACARAAGESFAAAATRVWGAREAVTKLGGTVTRPWLTLDGRHGEMAHAGWLAFRHGSDLVWSLRTTVGGPGPDRPVVLCVVEKG
ncbi:SDR family NAD(P)-dependent oxidoreductase [Nocardia panacis]|uniref:SDR family NAD(P)-dependent oxidoreductase n=1 Tax=Nocardia panacis TaxID=2340916 RepID=A0A3A4KEY7_9NOCA|nr:type I polyketide synthase [Nocardia panacis]RJO72526.1 SDR family NAD(P)-dependent oxidoreductase [Nocardia panacis]